MSQVQENQPCQDNDWEYQMTTDDLDDGSCFVHILYSIYCVCIDGLILVHDIVGYELVVDRLAARVMLITKRKGSFRVAVAVEIFVECPVHESMN